MLRKSKNSRAKTIYYRGNIKTDCTIFNKKNLCKQTKKLKFKHIKLFGSSQKFTEKCKKLAPLKKKYLRANQ